MPLRTRTRPRTQESEPVVDHAANLAALEAELAAAPERMKTAELAADEAGVLTVMARERVLPTLIRQARLEVLEQQIVERKEAVARTGRERERAKVAAQAAARDLAEAQGRSDLAVRRYTGAEQVSYGAFDALWELERPETN